MIKKKRISFDEWRAEKLAADPSYAKHLKNAKKWLKAKLAKFLTGKAKS